MNMKYEGPYRVVETFTDRKGNRIEIKRGHWVPRPGRRHAEIKLRKAVGARKAA